MVCPPTNPVDIIIRGYYPLIDSSVLTNMASAHPASSAQPGPTDPAAEPSVGYHTQGPHPLAPPPGSRRRLVRKASASAGPAKLGRSPAGRGPKQQGHVAVAEGSALTEEEEDWDVDAPPRKRAQQGSGSRAGKKSSGAPRAGKRSFFKGVTLKNKRSALALMNHTPSSACSGKQVVVQYLIPAHQGWNASCSLVCSMLCAATGSLFLIQQSCLKCASVHWSPPNTALLLQLHVVCDQESSACVTCLHSSMWCLLALQDCCDAVEWGTEAAHPPGLLALLPGCSPHQ